MELDLKHPGAAHPRVSGENTHISAGFVDPGGSSPRERGKLYFC